MHAWEESNEFCHYSYCKDVHHWQKLSTDDETVYIGVFKYAGSKFNGHAWEPQCHDLMPGDLSRGQKIDHNNCNYSSSIITILTSSVAIRAKLALQYKEYKKNIN